MNLNRFISWIDDNYTPVQDVAIETHEKMTLSALANGMNTVSVTPEFLHRLIQSEKIFKVLMGKLRT